MDFWTEAALQDSNLDGLLSAALTPHLSVFRWIVKHLPLGCSQPSFQRA